MLRNNFEARLLRLEQSRVTPVNQRSQSTFPSWFDTGAMQLHAEPGTDWRYRALPSQLDFHRDLTTRFKGYSGPIGSGKSLALAYEAILLSRLNPGLLGLIGAPTYPMLRDSTQRTFFEVLDNEQIAYTFHKQENKLRFSATGSEVIFRTLENPERLRGPNLAWFAIDELTYAREDAWTRMMGRLRHPQATRLCGCAVWTPKGYDWVYRLFIEQQDPDYRLVQAKARENIHLPSDFYDRLKGSYSTNFYRQEVLGEYLDLLGGSAYHAFSEKNIAPTRYRDDLPICWALDFNVDPLCSVIFQIEENWDASGRKKRKTLRVVDEIILKDSNTLEATEAFLHRIAEPDPDTGTPVREIRVYGDASGNSRTTKSARTDYELIRRAFQQHPEYRLEMRTNTSNPVVRDRVNLMNAVLCSATGERHAFIDPRCRELIKDLRQVRWRRDNAGNPMGDLDKSDPQRTHTSDALSYCVAREFDLRGTVGPIAAFLQ